LPLAAVLVFADPVPAIRDQNGRDPEPEISGHAKSLVLEESHFFGKFRRTGINYSKIAPLSMPPEPFLLKTCPISRAGSEPEWVAVVEKEGNAP
jgi:hypothetical protein